MSWLSKHWLILAEKINGAIFGFVFFWGTFAPLYHFEEKIYDYLGHLKHATGNGGYFDLQVIVFLVSCVVDFIWLVAPFSITGGIFY